MPKIGRLFLILVSMSPTPQTPQPPSIIRPLKYPSSTRASRKTRGALSGKPRDTYDNCDAFHAAFCPRASFWPTLWGTFLGPMLPPQQEKAARLAPWSGRHNVEIARRKRIVEYFALVEWVVELFSSLAQRIDLSNLDCSNQASKMRST